MKRRIGLLLAAASLLSAVGMFAPTPASATPDGTACVGQGRATLETGLFTPAGAKRTANFFFDFDLGNCAGLSAAGTLTGWCGNSIGRGTASTGHDFGWVSAGTVLTIMGELQGEVQAASDPTLGVGQNSCAGGTATEFIVNGAVTGHTCDTINDKDKGKTTGGVQTKTWACA